MVPKLELGYRRNTETGVPFNGVVVGFSFPLFENRNKVKIAKAQALNIDLQKDNATLQVESNWHSFTGSENTARFDGRIQQDFPVATRSVTAETSFDRWTN